MNIQEEKRPGELAHHGDEVIAGSIGESLEERERFGPSHVFRGK